jgi:polyisoprenoid-binding protein YceI
MKKLVLFLSLALMAPTVFAGSPPHIDKFNISSTDSKVEWFAEKVTGKHNGVVAIKSGTISNDHGSLTGTVTMDMQSIAVNDLEGKYKAKLEKHLKSDDFFSVEKHNEAVFKITSVTPLKGATKDGNNFNINGKLTIKGITNDVTFPAMINFAGGGMTAKGEMVIDRSKFDVRYGSPSFFDDIGDKAIYDEFKLKFNLTASK